MSAGAVDSKNSPRLAYLLGFIIAVGPVSVDIYLPAFGEIARRFGPHLPQLTLASYFGGFAIGQLAQGLLSDRFGRRLPLIAGLILYSFASLGCTAAPNGATLCACRALAAFGAAATIVIPRAMVRDTADGHVAASLMSDVLLVMSVAPVLAPLLGSLVLTFSSWRMIFLIAAVYGAAALYLVIRDLPETLEFRCRNAVRVASVVQLYRRILSERGFLIHACIGALGMAALFSYLAGAPAVFMGEGRMTPTAFGVVLSGLGLAMIGFFKVNRWVVRDRGPLAALNVGIVVWLVAGTMLCVAAWTSGPNIWWLTLALLVFSLGYSFIPSNAQVLALRRHAAHAAVATSLMSMLQYSAGAIAGVLIGVLADGTARPMAEAILVCAVAAALMTRWRQQATPVAADE